MGQWEQYNAKLLPLLPAELRPASKLIFLEIGDTPRGWLPEGIRNMMQRYDQEGFIPSLDIAPRGNQPGQAALAALADPLFGIDHEVASSSRFDARIQDLIRIVKEFGKPVIVRIGGEFNGRWNGYHPYAYPKAFRKIVERFRAAKVDNAAFVWCYEPAAPGDFDERNEAGEYKWFPGADVIDWFSIDWFNKEDFTGPLTGGRRGENAMTAHGRSRKFLDMAVAHKKPVMIAESAPCRYDLSDPAQAEAAWREWFEPYFQIIAERSEIKWFHLISYIKHYSQAYRPPEATEALRRLYQDLVEMEFTSSAASADLPFAGNPRLTIHRDVIYGKTYPDVQRLDAYLVKSTQPTPVLIEIHGGGWRRGSKSQFVYQGNLMEAVLAAGISVVSIDYRLTPEHRLPAQMEDVVHAVQFVRSRARDWNIDPNRIAALGGSAGAHLAAWIGLHDDLAQPDSTDPTERLSSRLTCFVALAGPMDLTRVDPRTLAKAGVRGESFAEAFTAAVGATAEEFMKDPDIRRRLKEASPLFLVSSDDPPALVVGAGPAEAALVPPTVPATINDPHSAWHGALLADALRHAGAEVVARLGPDVGKDPQADAAAIVDFLKKHLRRIDARSGR
jgi:acetyl esterase/lipase